METKLAIFKGKEIRKVLENNEWLFSVIDIIEVLTESTKPRDYWYRLKNVRKKAVELNCRQFVDS